MKYWKVIIFAAMFGIIGWGLVSLYVAKNKSAKDVQALKSQLEQVQSENGNLASELQYFQNPENLVKELKGQTTYTNPGEKVIILVPGTTSTATSATSTP